MTSQRRIYLVASAGFPNYGDELITLGWLRALAKIAPRDQVWLDCPNPGRASVLFAGAHPNLVVTDTLWTVARLAHQTDPADPWGRARHYVAHLGTPHVDLGILAVREADVLHLLGGGYVTSDWPDNLGIVSAAAAVAKARPGVRAFATGLGVTPLNERDRTELAAALAGFEFVDVRDHASAHAVGVAQGHDDAFLAMATGAFKVDPRPTPRAMILVQSDVHDPELARETAVAMTQAARAHTGSSRMIGVVEANPGFDGAVLDAVRQHAGGEVRFYPFAEVWREGWPVRADQAWFTTRFHPHLMAASVGARGVAVSLGSNYYGTKHASLEAEGTGWTVCGGEELSTATPSVDTAFPESAKRVAAQRLELAERLYASRSRGPFRR